ncbi:hypothetical protein [Caballeronia sp. GAWG1-1]|uniref:hypothetical protein n=1 Tax=Caballeronia sp. GAWG1-1 TaxID=2921742 RepID=UPI0020286691|nr:hypothetical protein [Caballeronia sp. GAWG1-1]
MSDQILEHTETAVIFKSDKWGPAVPYRAVDHQDGTFNHGFFDLRARPDEIENIPELRGRPGFATLVRTLNCESEYLMTLGCEAGIFQANFNGENVPTVYVGSYVNVAFRDPSHGKEENLTAVARFIAHEAGFTLQHWTKLEIGIEQMPAFFGHSGLYCLELKILSYGIDETMAWEVFNNATRRAATAIPKFALRPIAARSGNAGRNM